MNRLNIRSKLGNRIYFPDEFGKIVIPPDADKCHRCGTIYPRYEVKQEGKLDDFTETTDNPFDFGKGQILAVGESPKFDRTGKTQRKRKFKQDLSWIKDDDLRRELAKGAKLVYYQSTDG